MASCPALCGRGLVCSPQGQCVPAPPPPGRSRRALGLGVSLGSPAGINLQLGYWAGVELPLIVRFSGLKWSDAIVGGSLDVGYVFDYEGDFLQELDLFGIIFDATYRDRDLRMRGLGVLYGFTYYWIQLRGGLVFVGDGDFPLPQLHLQLAIAHRFALD